MEVMEQLGRQFLVTLGFTALGLFAFATAFFLITKFTPFSVRKEIEEDHNVAFAIILAAVIIGVAHIVAATVHG